MNDDESFEIKPKNAYFKGLAILTKDKNSEEVAEAIDSLNKLNENIDSNAAYYGDDKAEEVSNFFKKSHEHEDNVIKDMMRSLNEIHIPEGIVPNDKEWHWVRYAVSLTNYLEIDYSSIASYAQDGWKPIWAAQYPHLLTPAKERYSKLFIQYKDVILCERDKPKPEKVSFWKKLFWKRENI